MNWNHNIKVKKYKKTSPATSNVGYQTNVALESASSSELEIFAYSLFIYLFCASASIVWLKDHLRS